MEVNLQKLDSSYFKSEINFSSLPLFSLSRQGRNRKLYEYNIYKDKKTSASFIISANAAYGYPTAFDYKVFKAIEFIINGQQTIENPINISIYKICQLLNISIQNSENVRQSIKRLCLTGIESKGIFKSKTDNSTIYLNDCFTLYERVIFRNQILSNKEVSSHTYIFLSKPYLNNFKNNYTRYLNLNFFVSLRNDIARRLYDLLSLKFGGMTSAFLKYSYSNLCKILCIQEHKKFSYIYRTLKPSFNELVESGFLKNVCYSKLAQVYISFYPGPLYYNEKNIISNIHFLPDLFYTHNKRKDEIIDALVKRGFSAASVAINSTSNKRTLDEIELAIKDFDSRKDYIYNPIAWFNKILKMDYYFQPIGILTDEQKQQQANHKSIKENLANVTQKIYSLEGELNLYKEILLSSYDDQLFYFCSYNYNKLYDKIIFSLSDIPKDFIDDIKSNFDFHLNHLKSSVSNIEKQLSQLHSYQSELKTTIRKV